MGFKSSDKTFLKQIHTCLVTFWRKTLFFVSRWCVAWSARRPSYWTRWKNRAVWGPGRRCRQSRSSLLRGCIWGKSALSVHQDFDPIPIFGWVRFLFGKWTQMCLGISRRWTPASSHVLTPNDFPVRKWEKARVLGIILVGTRKASQLWEQYIKVIFSVKTETK